ncbi:MAG TPA: 1,4-alpha-glucan branching protein domain-containing protein [Planctomycetota bacterium]|jgi:1,4-alpha-glucan branching enzyme
MPKGYLQFVLHAHLPYVRHPEYERFLEERWFFEGVTDTYIPLIKFLDQLRDEGTPFKLTLSISPTLANMMEDRLLQERYLQHLDLSLRLTQREIDRTRHWPEMNALACMYHRLFQEARDVFTRCGNRLLSVFRQYADSGNLEIITCAATHGFLPGLAPEPTAVRAQIFSAIREHERLFGGRPKGMWLPECGYYPGLDALLAEAGIRYFFVDSHGIEHADPRPLSGVYAPLYCPSGVAAFGRCPATSRLVWSHKIGYPADPSYREYHRDIGYDLEQGYLHEFQYAPGVRSHTGIKYHRITGPTNDKQLYNPDRGRETAQRHASDFVHRCRDQIARLGSRMPFPGVIVSPYDAELFGHWWFEGPQWLYFVLRQVAASGDELALCTPSEYLGQYPVQQKATPAASTWGHNGYNEHWINNKTSAQWRPLHEAAVRMKQTVEKALGAASPLTPNPSPSRGRGEPDAGAALRDRVLRQAGRELLLAQASDWPFIITDGTTEQYARRRVEDHINRFHYLLNEHDAKQIDEQKLGALEYMDAIFPELDYKVFAERVTGDE